jgi:spore coat polysaccharide biosynthesis protein SpsF
MIAAIIQARTGSTRLPGKILRRTNNKTMLEHLLERVTRSTKIDKIIVATTINKQDDVIVKLCNDTKTLCIRGSEEDVLARYCQAANSVNADVVVRITSDNPLIDHRIIDEAIDIFCNDKYDYVSNYSLHSTTYPHGFAVEVLSVKSLNEANKETIKPSDREHVVFFITNRPNRYKIFQMNYKENLSSIRLTLDYEEDFQVIKSVFDELYPQNPDFTMNDVILWLNKNPQIKKINSNIKPHLNILKSFEEDKKKGF